ncbi:hypothetical protein LTR37_013577 [Vermiconidia calcicola]|uniref:Uncharacterized protein n=1 Tax=Vermiconidia calcicola TaxID=1690605 RepID=A0ACC3MYX6_9PEZI|nr:hypothetical protein LTR37_013577 [Vermiconidia calcicola]
MEDENVLQMFLPPQTLEPRSQVVESTEQQFNRRVAIEYDETAETLARCHSQDQSPLFSVLPRELRDYIWRLATSPFEDDWHSYEKNEYYYRPGHTARLKTHFELLLACRRVWLEANAFPMLQAEHCFWFYRAAPDARDTAWMKKLKPMNRENFGHLHMFVQMFAIENLTSSKGQLREKFLKGPAVEGDFQPRMFTVTIRHTDWWNWESDEPLRFEDSWFQAMLDTGDLRSTHIIKLELETLDYKVDNQLMSIVKRLSEMESRTIPTHLVNGIPTTTKFVLHGAPEVQRWSGPADINDTKYAPYSGTEQLNYCVVMLTWRLTFPDHPRAHVPTLRRAPRVVQEDTDRSKDDEWSPEPWRRTDCEITEILEPITRVLSKSHRRYMTRCIRDGCRSKTPLGYGKGLTTWNTTVNADPVCGESINRTNTFYAAEHEWFRRRMFDTAMKTEEAKKWRQKWKQEGSLLRFED